MDAALAPLDDYEAALHRLDAAAQRGRQSPTTEHMRANVAAAMDWVASVRTALTKLPQPDGQAG